jgi:hypothetical protein
MKIYETPAFVARGDVVRLTQGLIEGRTDPDLQTKAMPTGSVGFGL